MTNILTYATQKIRGSNKLSFVLRKRIENSWITESVGATLAVCAFFFAVVVPQVQAVSGVAVTYQEAVSRTIEESPTPLTYRWPLPSFGISQWFSFIHKGIDMTAPSGTPVYPSADGTVMLVDYMTLGYGNYIVIKHKENSITTLYAHLSKTLVKPGDVVTKDKQIGEVGATGWATGDHLHFEIMQEGIPLNPMEILPELTTNAIH